MVVSKKIEDPSGKDVTEEYLASEADLLPGDEVEIQVLAQSPHGQVGDDELVGLSLDVDGGGAVVDRGGVNAGLRDVEVLLGDLLVPGR